jgi:amino-acid N-acetyltransferase
MMKLELKSAELPEVDPTLETNLRKARLSDVDQIFELIKYWAEQGFMLVRSRSQLYENIRDFYVVEDAEGYIVGTVALHVLWADLAEIRSLAVHPARQGQGLGRWLVLASEREARDLHVPKVFTFTLQDGFFRKLGYQDIPREDLPPKVWVECADCPFQDNCHEIPLIKHLSGVDGKGSV